jgi:oligopeptide/dipeptide ABC transporter ATP-binding protein
VSDARTTSSNRELLRIEDLRVQFHTGAGLVRAVDGVSYDIRRGETLAVVGESGCGKSVTALSILRLLPPQKAEIASGSITFEGVELTSLPVEQLRSVRGNDIAMIFQEPMSSLNPVFTVGDQITEGLILHRKLDSEMARAEAATLLGLVGIPSPEQRLDEYPHQLSGGMRQRVMIAMALACRPKLLIADEPTTALDVTVQAQILELLRALQSKLGMSILLITHDLGVVAETADRVVVMYAGKIAERASVEDLFERPQHPYTAGLFQSLPRMDRDVEELSPIEGNVPDALSPPPGCRFHPRCAFAMQICREQEPELNERGGKSGEPHTSACFYVDQNPGADLLTLRRSKEAGT